MVVAARKLGRSAATRTISAPHARITINASAPITWSVRLAAPASARVRPALTTPTGPRRAPMTCSELLSAVRRSDHRYVDGLRALVALLRVVGHLRALLERAIAFAVDTCVVDEQVLVAIIGGDEAEPLVVAEPLHCAGRHVTFPPR